MTLLLALFVEMHFLYTKCLRYACLVTLCCLILKQRFSFVDYQLETHKMVIRLAQDVEQTPAWFRRHKSRVLAVEPEEIPKLAALSEES